MSENEEKCENYSDEAIEIAVNEAIELEVDGGDMVVGIGAAIAAVIGQAMKRDVRGLVAIAIVTAVSNAISEIMDELDASEREKIPATPNTAEGANPFSTGEPSLNDNGGYGPFPISNAEELLETEALTTIEELNRQFVILSETLATLNDPLLPTFAEAIKDVTNTINESIAQLDACMAEHACCEGETGDANAGVVEAAVDKGLIQPAFGLMPETDEEGGSEWEGGLVGQGIFPDAGGEQSSSPKEAARTVFQDLIPSVEQLDTRLSGLFDDIVKNGGDAFESLTSTAKGIIDQFASNVLGNLFQSMGPFGQIAQSLLGSFIPGLAGGGAFQPDSPVLVGERGPELLIPSAPGRIMNNHATGQFLGGAGGQPVVVHMHNNFQTDVKNAVRAEMMSYSSILTQATAKTIRNEMNLIYR